MITILPYRKLYFSLFFLLSVLFSNASFGQVPVITSNPSSISLCAGSKGVLQVTASNNPTSYIWQYSTNQYTWTTIVDDSTYSGSSTSTLTISTHNDFILDYQCFALNASGSSQPSNPAFLEVVSSIPQQPAPITGFDWGYGPGLITSFCGGLTQTFPYATNWWGSNEFSIAWTYSGNGVTIYPASNNTADSVTHVTYGPNATSGILSVTANNACGTSIPRTLDITVNLSQTTLAGTIGGPTTCSTVNYSQIISGGTLSDPACDPISSIVPSGANPVSSGQITSCVTIDGSIQNYLGNPYVQRHYNIDLLNNANSSTATATITLYYTQADFDNYNAVRGNLPGLPTGPSDALGISNIRITQFHGQGTSPGTFLGTSGEINPPDNNIVWNPAAIRWEITFDITGFSGFFISSVGLISGRPPAPTIQAGGDTIICQGENVVLTSSSTFNNQWYRNGVAISGDTSNSYPADSSGIYTVATTSNGITSPLSSGVAITVKPMPPKPTIEIKGIDLRSSAALGNQWFLDSVAISGANDSIIHPTISGNYEVQVTVDSCKSPLSDPYKFDTTISISSDSTLTIVPNPFTDKIIVTNNGNNPIRVQLFDMLGRQLIIVQNIIGVYNLGVGQFKQACYIIVVTDETTKKQKRRLLVKK
jgi:hypothetical protein